MMAATSLAIVPAGTATAASPETGTVVSVELEPRTNNGLRAQLETSNDEMVTLELGRKGQAVSYETQGEVTDAGLKVRFSRAPF
jgi:hypothetical protein